MLGDRNHFDWTSEVLDLEEFKRSLGSAPPVEFNAEGGLRGAAKWQELKAGWHSVLSLETTIGITCATLRGLSGKMEASVKRVLTAEEKSEAKLDDVLQWVKAVSAAQSTLPEAEGILQRAPLLNALPKRKKVGEFFQTAEVIVPVREMDPVLQDLKALQKDLQALAEQGLGIATRCKSVCADLLEASRRLRPAKWRELEARWRAILGLEANIEALRIRLKGFWEEMEATFKSALPVCERRHASGVALSQWTKAKSRVQDALPKAKDFVQRATWVRSTPERRRLGELFKNADGVILPASSLDQTLNELERMRGGLQHLLACGWAVSSECKSVAFVFAEAMKRMEKRIGKRGVSLAKCKYAYLGL
jgi:hypothetical protein